MSEIEILSREKVERIDLDDCEFFSLVGGGEICVTGEKLRATFAALNEGRRLALKALEAWKRLGDPESGGVLEMDRAVQLGIAARDHAEQMRKDGWPDE